jgi:hypothetical protein
MTQPNKAYVVITGLTRSTTPAVLYDVLLVHPDDTMDSAVSAQDSAPFDYGDSNQAIRQAIVADVRSTIGDPDLDVNFVTG